jgi:4-amino-4-deoxy-L-arabinose transferase-like glycosyltransferase
MTDDHKISPPRLLFGVVAIAVALRVCVALYLGDRANPVSGAADQFSYDTLAQRVLSGHGFSFPSKWYPFTAADEPTAHWSYLYTLYLAGVYALVGHHPLAARLMQALLSGLGSWLTYRIGAQLFGRYAGVAAAALAAIYAYFVFFNAALMTQTFYILALQAALLTALSLAQRPTRRGWVLLGIFLGLGVLLRQTLLLFTPLLFAWIASTCRTQFRWRDLLTSVAIVALLILPWTVYNYRTFGDFLLLNSNGGFFLYSSNHPTQGTHFDPNYSAPLPEELRGQSEPAIDRALYRQAIGFIVADPWRFVRLTLSRVPHYFWVLPSEVSPAINSVARTFSFTLYMPFMIWGLLLTRRHWRACLPLYLYVAFDTTLHLTSWAAPRYRLPSDAVMMVFAGAALVDVAQRCGWIDRQASE